MVAVVSFGLVFSIAHTYLICSLILYSLSESYVGAGVVDLNFALG